jgi:hypothetical protein
MNQFMLNGISTGLFTSIFGSIFLSMIINHQIKESKDKIWINNKLQFLKKFKIIEASFFLLGVIVFLLLEYFDFNKWYCEKICIGDKCRTKCFYKPN